ncbi:hypothetical protein FN976_20425 [Caenimonas sedimenti]|uniref:Uncharacterized protein n=1 Tax=Caenimonas sedimenti TaxID=2596921 RepID=A0A562ZLQ2_9BURK|nr:hypothetical protein [Caenimonas sedimenti]TWO69104.1 hypothetical protein FN976_20425 [Caenimonas sedimenti]
MASAAARKSLPEGFTVPFAVVHQLSRHDCILAAIGTLTGKTLDEVWAAAYKLGVPKIGQYYINEQHAAALLMQLGGLVASRWKDFDSFDALPDVALIWVDADPKDSEGITGRTIIFHHVREVPGKYTSFSYCLDIFQSDPERQIVVDYKQFAPTSYIAVTAKPAGKGK